jgi:single-stranded DNA-binding protein
MYEQEINRVLLSGRLLSEPDLRELYGGTPVCFLRLAVATKRSTPGGSRRRTGEFNVLVLGARARRIAPYLYTGRRVVVQGCLGMEGWEMGEGPEHEAVCVLAERIHLAGDAPRGAQTREFAIPAHASDVALGVSGAVGFSEEMWC